VGGVTAGHFGDGQDRLGGISDFTRLVSDDVLQVAEEWVFEPTSIAAVVARKLKARLAFPLRADALEPSNPPRLPAEATLGEHLTETTGVGSARGQAHPLPE
jgi:hypothetical protein